MLGVMREQAMKQRGEQHHQQKTPLWRVWHAVGQMGRHQGLPSASGRHPEHRWGDDVLEGFPHVAERRRDGSTSTLGDDASSMGCPRNEVVYHFAFAGFQTCR